MKVTDKILYYREGMKCIGTITEINQKTGSVTVFETSCGRADTHFIRKADIIEVL